MFLHHHIITGPIKSRRLGNSLGVNILPSNHKICNYNCIYCECGWAPAHEDSRAIPTREQVAEALEFSLKEAKKNATPIDSITFSGNGESTTHPEFCGIMEDTFRLRNELAPNVKITVISNATKIGDAKIADALHKADILMLKLDAGTEDLYKSINKNRDGLTFERLVDNLKTFPYPFILQTLFFRGYDETAPSKDDAEGEITFKRIDNTEGEAFDKWLAIVKEIKPQSVMVYGLDRETPAKKLEKLSLEDLESIVQKIKNAGIDAKAYY